MNSNKLLIGLAAATILAACNGGGGGSSSTTATSFLPAGTYYESGVIISGNSCSNVDLSGTIISNGTGTLTESGTGISTYVNFAANPCLAIESLGASEVWSNCSVNGESATFTANFTAPGETCTLTGYLLPK